MTRKDFVVLFTTYLNYAADSAEARLRHPVPRHFGILRDSPGTDGRRTSVDDVIAELWLSDDRFYRIVDLAVAEVSPSTTWVWVHESGHEPCAFEDTWNHPPGAGPFKILKPKTIRESSDESV